MKKTSKSCVIITQIILSLLLSSSYIFSQMMPPVVIGSPPAAAGGFAITQIATTNVSFGAPYSISLSSSANSGDTVFCTFHGNQANSGTKYSMTTSDSQTDTWVYPTNSTNTTQEYLNSGFAPILGFAYSAITHNLVSGVDHITFNPANDGAWQINCYDVSGLSNNTLDQAVGSTGSFGTAQNSSNLTPNTTPEFGFCAIGDTVAWSAYGNVGGVAATGLSHGVTYSGGLYVAEWATVNSGSAHNCGYTAGSNTTASIIYFLLK